VIGRINDKAILRAGLRAIEERPGAKDAWPDQRTLLDTSAEPVYGVEGAARVANRSHAVCDERRAGYVADVNQMGMHIPKAWNQELARAVDDFVNSSQIGLAVNNLGDAIARNDDGNARARRRASTVNQRNAGDRDGPRRSGLRNFLE